MTLLPNFFHTDFSPAVIDSRDPLHVVKLGRPLELVIGASSVRQAEKEVVSKAAFVVLLPQQPRADACCLVLPVPEDATQRAQALGQLANQSRTIAGNVVAFVLGHEQGTTEEISGALTRDLGPGVTCTPLRPKPGWMTVSINTSPNGSVSSNDMEQWQTVQE